MLLLDLVRYYYHQLIKKENTMIKNLTEGNKMIKNLFRTTALLGAILSTTAFAQDMSIVIPQAPGGGGHILTNMLRTGLNAKGYNVAEVRALNNCALAKKQWDEATGPILTMWDSPYNNVKTPECNMPMTPDTFIMVGIDLPAAFCSIKNISLEDYMKDKKNYTVGVQRHVPHKTLFAHIEKEVGNKHTLLNYKNASDVQAALKSGEIDFAFIGQVWSERVGAKCLWSTASMPLENIKLLKEVWPSNPIAEGSNLGWYLAKNLNQQQIDKLRLDIREIYKSTEIVEFNNTRGYIGQNYTFDQAKKIETNSRRISEFE
jgi:tripartite-type tricarboxylate transporter receptor subunit TctC